MGDPIEEMHIEIEQKDEKKRIFQNKIGLQHSEVIEEMKRFGFNKISSKRKCDRTMDRLRNLA